MTTLYELTTEAAALLALLEEYADEGEEAIAAIEKYLIGNQQETSEKIAGYIAVLREIESTRDARKAEADRLAASAKRADANAKRLKDRLTWYLEQTGQDKIETRLGRVGTRRSTSVEYHGDIGSLPAEYVREKTSKDLDKKALGDALKRGEIIPEALLVEKKHLTIK